MEYQKIANIRGVYSPNKQIRFKTAMLGSSLVIKVMHIYLLKEKYQLITLLLQIISIKK